nr:aspartate kinase [Ardenticatena sp.]
MSRLVMKFGGTSVGNADAIRRVGEILKQSYTEGHDVVAVVSAMRGVTDMLIDAALAAAQGDDAAARSASTTIWERHAEAAGVLLGRTTGPDLAAIKQELSMFMHLCEAIAILGEVTPRAMDLISSLGERFSARLVASYLQTQDVPAEAIIANELIVTDECFGAANPLLDETGQRTRARLLPLLEQRTLPVVTGFLAATRDGIVTTLGRGGSDYTAAILGHALDADEIWIWTDVDGVLTADPRIVPNARTLSRIGYTEAAEMAYFGARVLHPKTVRPAVEKRIPVRILNTFNPTHPGTLIVPDDTVNGRAVKAVTAIRNLALVTVEGRGMLGVPGVAARVFGAAAHSDVSVLMISQSSSEQSICFVVPSDASLRVVQALEQEFMHELSIGAIDRVWVQDDVVIVAVVGGGMRRTPGIASRVFGALGEHEINVVSIAQGSSEYNLSLVVEAADANDAVRAIHDAFSLGEPPVEDAPAVVAPK